MRDANGLRYFLRDHLGSVSVVLSDRDENGNVEILERQRYLSFGGVRTDLAAPAFRITNTDFTYTGQRNLSDIGLMDYKARFYSPTLGRFIQPDSIVPNAVNPQGFNKYSYVINNPLRYADPTGHKWDECKEGQSDYLCKQHMKRVGKIKANWNNIANPEDDPYIAFTIDGRNYWADCLIYNHGNSSDCTASTQTYHLSGQNAFRALWMLKNNIDPLSFGLELGTDAWVEAVDAAMSAAELAPIGPFVGLFRSIQKELHSQTVDNAFDAMASVSYSSMLRNKNSTVPPMNITFTRHLSDIRLFTKFEQYTTAPFTPGTYHGRYAGYVMTIALNDGTTSNFYLGEASGYGTGFDSVLTIISGLSE